MGWFFVCRPVLFLRLSSPPLSLFVITVREPGSKMIYGSIFPASGSRIPLAALTVPGRQKLSGFRIKVEPQGRTELLQSDTARPARQRSDRFRSPPLAEYDGTRGAQRTVAPPGGARRERGARRTVRASRHGATQRGRRTQAAAAALFPRFLWRDRETGPGVWGRGSSPVKED